MKFTLEINMANATFEGYQGINEIQRLLECVSVHIDAFNTLKVNQARFLYDTNGNKVGTWEVTE
jgi:hypothetical protein